MASSNEPVSMALFCDFENVALGVRDANYEKFDIKPILERLLLKGSIVVKKAYCDWDRYKGFKATMHEANFELIEIPHVRQSGKNSADIRLVVDALDLCYTKSHVNTFVIISGDSDFSPLVSKLRENAKQVIGVGVKQSTSDLLIANCDEFIFYDDLVRESRRAEAKRDARETAPTAKRAPSDEETRRKDKFEVRKTQAIEIAVETFDALVSERGDSGKIWASVLKEAIKRRKPDFSESYYGFRTFGNLLEEAQARGLLQFGRDEKSGAYVYRSSSPTTVIVNEAVLEQSLPVQDEPALLSEPEALAPAEPAADAVEATPYKQEPRRNGRGGRKQPSRQGSGQGQRNGGNNGNSDALANAVAQEPAATTFEHAPQAFDSAADNVETEEATFTVAPAPVAEQDADASGADASGAAASAPATPDVVADSGNQREPRRNGRGGRKSGGKKNAPYEARTTEPSFADSAPAQPQAAPDVVTEIVPEAVPAPVSPYAAPTTFETRAIPAHDDIADSTDTDSATPDEDTVAPAPRRNSRGARKPAAKKSAAKAEAVPTPVPAPAEAAAPVIDTPAPAEPVVTPDSGDQPVRKPAARSRRPRKASVTQEG